MNLSDIQKLSSDIAEKIRVKRGAEATDYVSVLHIVEEFGEIARQLYNLERKRKDFSKENLDEEFADLIMLIADFSYRKNVDLTSAIHKKVEKLKAKHDLSGI